MSVYDLNSRYDQLPDACVGEARKTLAGAHQRIVHAVTQLDESDIWWRPHDSMNAVGNIILHLCGNLGQWVIAGVGGRDYVRDRPAEFAQRGGIAKDQLLARLRDAVSEADDVISKVDPGTLLSPRRIQSFDVAVVAAIFHAVSHFEGHAQEVIYIARLRRGEAYRFLWTPSDAQQSAP
jgi:hypothetical protein